MNNGIQLIILLGNPGREYVLTRHNAGRILSRYGRLSGTVWNNKFKGLVGSIAHSTARIHLLQPETFMNNSGESVRAAADFYKIEAERVLVVHDELSLPFGTFEFRKGGGTGGHNGLRSITRHLGDQEFWRLRIGIGRPSHGNVSGYVLSRFTDEEQKWLDTLYDGISNELESFLAEKKNMKKQVFT